MKFKSLFDLIKLLYLDNGDEPQILTVSLEKNLYLNLKYFAIILTNISKPL